MATNNNNDTEFKFDKNLALELAYIDIIRQWLKYAKENRVCHNTINSKHDLDCMVGDFFIEKNVTDNNSSIIITLTK